MQWEAPRRERPASDRAGGMRLTIDRRQVDPELVTYNPGVGFGRFDSDTIEVHSYELFIDRTDLLDALSDRYRAVCEEIRADDEKFGEESEFTPSGYVDLAEAFSFPDALAASIGTYFDREILNIYVTYRERFVYVINSVDEITVSADGIRFEGRCFRHLERPTAVGGRPPG